MSTQSVVHESAKPGNKTIRAYVEHVQGEFGPALTAFAEEYWDKSIAGQDESPAAMKSRLRELASAAIASEDDEQRSELTILYSDFIYEISVSDSAGVWKQAFLRFSQRVNDAFSAIAKSRGGDQISRVKKYVNEHLADSLSLTSVADEFYLNHSYLSRLFKEKTGSTFSEYLSAQRIEVAKQLLSGTDLSVVDVAARVGYGMSDSFSRLFKKATGLPPQKYRSLYSASRGGAAGIRNTPVVDMGPCAADQNGADFFAKR